MKMMFSVLLYALTVCLPVGAVTFDTLYTCVYDSIDLSGSNFKMYHASDDGVIIAAQVNDGGLHDVVLVRLGPNLDMQWHKRYEFHETMPSRIGNVFEQQDRMIVTIGSAWTSDNEGGLAFMLTDSSGDSLWTKRYQGAEASIYDAVRTRDGGYFASGARKTGGTRQHIWIIRMDSTGDTLWTRDIDPDSSFSGFCAVPATDGGFVLGCLGSEGSRIMKLDSSGATIWTRFYHQVARTNTIIEDADGGFYVVGTTFDPTTPTGMVCKLDSTGAMEWFNKYGTGTDYGQDHLFDGLINADGDFVYTGTYDGTSYARAWFGVLDSVSPGSLAHDLQFCSGYDGFAVLETGWNQYVVGGQTDKTRLFVARIEDIESVPVELAGFTAVRAEHGTVTLHWSTVSETDNLGWNIFRSMPTGGGMAAVNNSLIPGNGTASMTHRYEYVDMDAVDGPVMYSLEQVDTDGQTYIVASVFLDGVAGVTALGKYRAFLRNSGTEWYGITGTRVGSYGSVGIRIRIDGDSMLRKTLVVH